MPNETDQTTTTDTAIRKLVLARETLRTLTSDELRLAAGGAARPSNSDRPGC